MIGHFKLCTFSFQSTAKGDSVEILKKQLQDKDAQILEGELEYRHNYLTVLSSL